MKMTFFVALLCLFSIGQAHASGFAVFTQGARGLGQANAVVAHDTGASSLYFNPALLSRVSGLRVEAGTTMVYADREYTSSLIGITESGDESARYPSHFYLTGQFSSNLSGGVGVFFPFGLSTEWDSRWEGRYIATRSDLATVNINPVLAWQVTDRISLAGGVDIIHLEAELERQINSTALGVVLNPPGGFGLLSDSGQMFSGDGWGIGYNLGLLVDIRQDLHFGATFRSHVDVAVDGDLDFSIPADAAMLSAVLTDTTGHADVRLPSQATFGLAWDVTDQLVMEVGARWEDWSSTGELRVRLDRPVLGQTYDVTPRGWDDTWAFNIGGSYRVNDSLILLAGYLYSDNPVPDSTFDPSIPDADAHLFTLGAGITRGKWQFDLAYGFEHHPAREKNNLIGAALGAAANGKYSSNIHLAAMSLGYRF
ncbi:MAG: outer membrane protein transport protein [Geothermobacteraceae bacterium]